LNIDKLKIDGSTITVDYSVLTESFRIQTGDEAKTSLYQAASNVAILAREALAVVAEGAGFLAIAYSHSDKPGSRIILALPCLEVDDAKIALPKISADPIRDEGTGEIVPNHPVNIYNEAAAILHAEACEFVKGKRMQMALPFADGFDAGMDLDDRETDQADNTTVQVDFGNTLEFPRPAAAQ
jgi:hypothetical protein